MPNRLSPPLLAALALVAAASIVAWGAWSRSQSEALARAEADLGALRLDVEAPDVSLLNHTGAVPLASYRGRLVFVNFWATWCGPCREETPSLVALRRSFAEDDVAFVSIAEDDTWPPLDGYLAANPLPFDVYRDQPPRVEDQFEVKAYPASFLIDRDGRALYRFDGARNWDTEAARTLLSAHGARVLGR